MQIHHDCAPGLATHPLRTLSLRCSRLASSGMVTAFLLSLTLSIVFPSHAWSQAFLDEIGYTALRSELGNAIADGTGVSVSHVEAPEVGNNYSPNPSSSEFVGKSFNVVGATGVSGHATTVGRNLYGLSGVAAGVTDIDVYNANSYLRADQLGFGLASEPLTETQDIQNHSWITNSMGSIASNQQVLRRLDYLINRDDVTVIAALNNGSATNVPAILANSFNSIVVGLTNGLHSTGQTTVDTPFRQVPHIVAPDNFTSFSSPMVAGGAALLLDAARRDTNLILADRNEVIRSLLLAGATKTEFSNWSNSPSQPLDDQFGAGELNIQRSYHILDAGRQASNTIGDAQGWNLQTDAVGTNTYYFDVTGQELEEFSAILTWNREVTDSNPFSTFTPAYSGLNNLDLRLYSATGFNLGDVLAESVSDDNVEHIYFNDALDMGGPLAPGRYALVVDAGSAAQDYALAWLGTTGPLPVSACDFDGDGDCDPNDLDVLYANFGLINPVFDIDGSGSVNAADIVKWLEAASNPANPFNANGVTFVLGDIEFNGSVDSSDLGRILNNFTKNGILSYGDGNLDDDSIIGSTDLGLLLNNFPFHSNSLANVTAAAADTSLVPEPPFSALSGMVWFAVAAIAVRRRRHGLRARAFAQQS